MLYEEKIIETIPVGPLGRQPHTGFFGRLGKEDHEIIDHTVEIERLHFYALNGVYPLKA